MRMIAAARAPILATLLFLTMLVAGVLTAAAQPVPPRLADEPTEAGRRLKQAPAHRSGKRATRKATQDKLPKTAPVPPPRPDDTGPDKGEAAEGDAKADEDNASADSSKEKAEEVTPDEQPANAEGQPSDDTPEAAPDEDVPLPEARPDDVPEAKDKAEEKPAPEKKASPADEDEPDASEPDDAKPSGAEKPKAEPPPEETAPEADRPADETPEANKPDDAAAKDADDGESGAEPDDEEEASAPEDFEPLSEQGKTCRADLKQMGVSFTEAEPVSQDGCLMPHPLTVTALADGVALEPKGEMNCAMTEAIARFVEEVVQPAAYRHFGQGVKAVSHASAFVCRPRAGTHTLSEHAFGNALDIAAFVLEDGTSVPVKAYDASKQDELDREMFMDEVRAAACGPFKTVLGPGSNAAHATHFHLDIKKRGAGYKVCE